MFLISIKFFERCQPFKSPFKSHTKKLKRKNFLSRQDFSTDSFSHNTMEKEKNSTTRKTPTKKNLFFLFHCSNNPTKCRFLLHWGFYFNLINQYFLCRKLTFFMGKRGKIKVLWCSFFLIIFLALKYQAAP